jgi:CheY-like chemotaxis protein
MNQKPILLVEDNPDDELLTLRSLRRARVANRIDVVRDGQQALDYLFHEGAFAHRPDPALPILILLDIGLPRLSGLEVLQRVRTDPRTARVPIAILTSSDDLKDRLGAYRYGCNSFVRKPIEFAQFAETLARLDMYWIATDEPPPPR